MSKWFKKIKVWYEAGYWNTEMVKNAVVKGKITTEEYKAITGKEYVTD
ncbi:XkdX family protein [Acidaminococcus sp. HCP3S3_G9_1]